MIVNSTLELTIIPSLCHKIGGSPALCQPGHWFGADYPFVMQISSDEKAGFNIVDAGNFYFYYNADKGDWKVHCDFY
jgi:hypothetical protein